MQSLIDVIEQLEKTAKIPALKTIVHSSMARCIGSIRQHLREQARIVRNENGPCSLDERNAHDESVRSSDELTEAMGFKPRVPALRMASLYHDLYGWANDELRTIATNKWEEPLKLEQMLDFMTNKSRKLDKAFVEALAVAVGTDIKTIERLNEVQERREREQLMEDTPEITTIFNGFSADGGDPEAFEKLPVIAQHQLGVKVVENLNKARDQALAYILRTHRISDLASVPIIEDAAKKVSQWVKDFEHANSETLGEAIETGYPVRSLEDVA